MIFRTDIFNYCMLCFYLISVVNSDMIETMKRQWQLTRESDETHPCFRGCVRGETMECNYSMVVDWYTSMSVQCGDCPHNLTDCAAPGCVSGGGIVRPVATANRRAPGPNIMVCEGDVVVVDVTNAMDHEEMTIHWHGLHQVDTPYMDGAPYVTQCPIPPGRTFRYRFHASPHGTHMWHGHVGYHDASGLFGSFIVRRQESDYVSRLYDYDLPEHTVIIWHWYNETDRSVLPPILHTFGKVKGYGLLVNGHASFGKFPSRMNQSEMISTPRAKFFVEQGKRYRFRLIDNSAIYCPVQFSIDNHTMLMIASETNAFRPISVDSVMLNAGERFSFVLHANLSGGCYWVRMRGLGDCGPAKSSTHGEALLCYGNSSIDPSDTPTYEQARRSGVLLNPVQVFKGEDYSENQLVLISSMVGVDPEPYSYNGTPDATIYVQLHSRTYSNADAPGPWPQFNNVTFESTPFSMLTQRGMLAADPRALCDWDLRPGPQHCIGDFCSCTLTKRVSLNSLVEVVMVDISVLREQDHPVHLHGFKFHVVAMGTVGDEISLDHVRDLNERTLIDKNLTKAPFKDTISVPNAGYAIIRFKADNPGYWLLHCHVANHLIMGMALVIQVGEHEDMAETPADFPTCISDLYDSADHHSGTTLPNAISRFKLLLLFTALGSFRLIINRSSLHR